jgi:transcriptional regulator with XRE-family HTH domain
LPAGERNQEEALLEADALLAFGERLRELRAARELSQEALAFEAGLDRTYVSSVERGKRNVSLITIHRLAAALDVGPDELLRRPGSA